MFISIKRTGASFPFFKLDGCIGIVPLLFAAFLLFVTACSSTQVVKTFNKKGHIREIRLVHQDELKQRICFEYNKKNKINKITRFVPSHKAPVVIRKFKYYSSGKLRLQQFQGTQYEGNKSVLDSWVESFFYNKTRNLKRIETAYKSSLSISQNKTPFKTTRFYYKYKRLERIKVEGGTFRKLYTLHYIKDRMDFLAYNLLLMNRKTRKYEKQKDFRIWYKDERPHRIEDLLENKKIKSHDQVDKIVTIEEIDEPFIKLKYAADFQNFINAIELGLVVEEN